MKVIIVGGQGKAMGDLQRTLGIDEFGLSSGTLGSQTGNIPTRRVASSGSSEYNESSSSQIVSVGKRLSDKAVLSYEQSMSTTESIVKLTVTLRDRLYLIARTGSENALDIFYRFRFGK